MTDLHSSPSRRWNPNVRNYLAFLLEGSLFIGGVGFVNGQTLLPALIIQENGPTWLAALVPSMMVIGLFGAPVFTARKVDRLPRMKPFVLLTSTAMRLVYLGAILMFLLPWLTHKMAIWILALTPLLAGFCGGLGLTAWQRLFTASVSAKLRPSNIALRFLLGGLFGILAGRTIEWVLGNFSFIPAMAVLHAIAFAVLMASLLVLCAVKEPENIGSVDVTAPITDQSGLREGFGDLLGAGPDRRTRISFFLSVVLMHGFFLTTPFFAAHLLELLDQPTQFLGILAMWQMIGMSAGNLFAAWAGGIWGGRFTLALGSLGMAAILLLVPLIDCVGLASALYASYATVTMLMIVGKDSLVLDFTPPKRQGRYLTAMGVTTMVAILSASILGFLLYEAFDNFTILTSAGTVISLLCFLACSYVNEPRSDVQRDPLKALYQGALRYFR